MNRHRPWDARWEPFLARVGQSPSKIAARSPQRGAHSHDWARKVPFPRFLQFVHCFSISRLRSDRAVEKTGQVGRPVSSRCDARNMRANFRRSWIRQEISVGRGEGVRHRARADAGVVLVQTSSPLLPLTKAGTRSGRYVGHASEKTTYRYRICDRRSWRRRRRLQRKSEIFGLLHVLVACFPRNSWTFWPGGTQCLDSSRDDTAYWKVDEEKGATPMAPFVPAHPVGTAPEMLCKAEVDNES
jgi:hypothetical protein